MTLFVLRTLAYMVWSGMVFFAGYVEGQASVREEYECVCGQSEPCAFGPGIIGNRSCGYDRTWAACTPDPNYRVPLTEAAP